MMTQGFGNLILLKNIQLILHHGERGRRVEMFMTDLGIMFGRVMLQGLMFPPQ